MNPDTRRLVWEITLSEPALFTRSSFRWPGLGGGATAQAILALLKAFEESEKKK